MTSGSIFFYQNWLTFLLALWLSFLLTKAEYTPDNWKIRDSYRINDTDAMKEICAALLEIHPIYAADMSSYRTADDMAYEWDQHNIAYSLLPDGSTLKESAADVDLKRI